MPGSHYGISCDLGSYFLRTLTELMDPFVILHSDGRESCWLSILFANVSLSDVDASTGTPPVMLDMGRVI